MPPTPFSERPQRPRRGSLPLSPPRLRRRLRRRRRLPARREGKKGPWCPTRKGRVSGAPWRERGEERSPLSLPLVLAATVTARPPPSSSLSLNSVLPSEAPFPGCRGGERAWRVDSMGRGGKGGERQQSERGKSPPTLLAGWSPARPPRCIGRERETEWESGALSHLRFHEVSPSVPFSRQPSSWCFLGLLPFP